MGRGSHVAVSCGVGRRRSLDPTLLWLWCRLAAVALIRPLAWRLPYATGAAPPPKKRKKEKEMILRCIWGVNIYPRSAKQDSYEL